MDDASKLCIIDGATISISKEFPGPSSLPKVTQVVSIPLLCQDILSNKGLQSASWSSDGQKIAIVCGDSFDRDEQEVCIVPLDTETESYCWDHSWQYYVARVEWSPKEDRILVSSTNGYGSKIYITNAYGKDQVYLTDGWGATWSPNGKRIAFMQWQNKFFQLEEGKIIIDEKINQFSGLAVINKDGTGLKWLYRNPDDAGGQMDIISLNCDGMANVCRASWSPDGRYIVFSGGSGGMYSFHIFRLDLKTGKIIFLSPIDEYSRFVSEPDWGR